MIYYSKEQESLPARVKELTRSQMKIPLILLPIVFVFAVYFLVVGFLTDDREAWINAYSSVFLFVLLALCLLQHFTVLRSNCTERSGKSPLTEK